jgi:hypothetical protein
LTVRQGRDAYLAENGFTIGAYDAPKTDAAVLGVRIQVPNTARHRWAIMLHDLHHVATGYGTDMAGEAEISAWEARRGLGGVGAYVAAIIVSGALSGVLVAPRRTARAWSLPVTTRSLFVENIDYPALLELTIGELRERLGVPQTGLSGSRSLHAFAPSATARPAT